MKILMIGGTGLISTPITELLVERGEAVTLYNRGKSSLPTHPKARVITGDRTDYPAFETQMAEAGMFDVVIDMVGYKPNDGLSAVRAFKGKVGQFIFCSTVDVYRKPALRYPYLESEPYGGLNEYSANKVVLEKQLIEAQASGAFPLTIIRPAYTYGESRGPLHPMGGGTRLIDRLRKGKPVVLHGDGSSLWVACHREDVARAFANASGNPLTFGRSYHTAGEEWMTWNQYLQRVAYALGAPEPNIVHIPTDVLAAAAPKRMHWVATNFKFNNIFDNTTARLDLGFRYTIPWVTGVRKMVDWLDEHGKVEPCESDPFEDRLIEVWKKMGSELAGKFDE